MIIRTTRDDGIGNQLLSIRDFLIEVNGLKFNDEIIELDFCTYKFSPPLLGIFFAAFLEGNPKYRAVNIGSTGYLNYQYFPFGLKPEVIEEWEQLLDAYKCKSYLPLIRFSTLKNDDATQTRNNVISHANLMIGSITGMPANYKSAISYLLSEISDNIVDHSRAEYGWISFQYYPQKGYLDLCIADAGIGLLQSYKKYRGEKDYSHIENHLEAVEYVIKGESTKDQHERGYGVHTSREILLKGLKGKFVMFSGNGLMIDYNLLDFQCHYDGTLVMFRIPCGNYDDNFGIYSFVE
ncbi:ATP-binding protein [Anaerophaga thermohalophila]|jgi:hypothetical protein|uniref:ATP-binding protein n=1 Tax=Anaerophaga thermohalophila TaxID=177400 RepID=UPI000366E7D3|nr:ATP-binding protein [Anaerophaga thermohalophila]